MGNPMEKRKGRSGTSPDQTSTVQMASAILREVASPYAINLLSHITSSNWLCVVNYPMPDPRDYSSAELFARDYLAWNLLRKADFLPCGIDTEKVAIGKFLESEEACRAINHYHGRNPFVPACDTSMDRSFEAVIHTAKDKIARLLGVFSWDKIEPLFGFSGGSSTRLRRKSGHPFYKYQGKPDVTPAASVLGVCAMWVVPAWSNNLDRNNPEQWVNLVRGSKAFTVPKTAKEDRFACAEPDLNMYTQRGLGAFIRRRLKSVHIDLDDQTWNQHLALIGSRTGSLVTIDLKAASDSIALSLVEALLPGDWYQALCLTRSPYTRLPDGSWHELEKISSMGNGYTFELESLIFWALSAAVQDLWSVEDRRLGVYGDDIVVHRDIAAPLIAVLEYCGFQTNVEKTFIDGPFRESCGKHYFYGQDVTPFNIKESILGANRSYWLVNSLNIWLSRGYLSVASGIRLLAYSLKKFRVRVQHVPGNLGSEQGVWVPSVEVAETFYSLSVARGGGGYLYSALRPVRRKHKPQGWPALLTWLSSRGSAIECGIPLVLEKGDVVYARFKRATTVWPDVPVRFVINSSGISLYR